MGRITKVNANKEGVIREVELILPSKRITRRPINLLVPLGLKDEEENEDTMPSSPRQGNDTDSGIRNVSEVQPPCSEGDQEVQLQEQ